MELGSGSWFGATTLVGASTPVGAWLVPVVTLEFIKKRPLFSSESMRLVAMRKYEKTLFFGRGILRIRNVDH